MKRLDFSDLNQTLNFTDKVCKHIGGVKVGLEFFVKYGIEGVLKIKNFGILSQKQLNEKQMKLKF